MIEKFIVELSESQPWKIYGALMPGQIMFRKLSKWVVFSFGLYISNEMMFTKSKLYLCNELNVVKKEKDH